MSAEGESEKKLDFTKLPADKQIEVLAKAIALQQKQIGEIAKNIESLTSVISELAKKGGGEPPSWLQPVIGAIVKDLTEPRSPLEDLMKMFLVRRMKTMMLWDLAFEKQVAKSVGKAAVKEIDNIFAEAFGKKRRGRKLTSEQARKPAKLRWAKAKKEEGE